MDSSYNYATYIKSCTTSSINDLCASKCCLQTVGPLTNNISRCTPSSYCSSGFSVFSRQYYFQCTTDQSQNICADMCCGKYVFPIFGGSVTRCQKEHKCQGLYPASLYWQASVQNIRDYQKLGNGGVTTATGIILGVNLSIIAILIVLLVLIYLKMKKFNAQTEQAERQRPMQLQNTTIPAQNHDPNPIPGDFSVDQLNHRPNQTVNPPEALVQ